MVVFFAEKMQPWKTKLNKLLFYADFLMHSKTGFSISGVQYRAISMGPVPNNFNGIFEYLSNKGNVTIHYTCFPDGGPGEQFMPNPNQPFKKEYFSEAELEVLNHVTKRFKNTSTTEIIEISHKEKAWIDNNAGSKLIDYNYSFDIKL